MNLLTKLRERSALVSVIGLGYAGLPLAVAFAEAGFPVVGVDVDAGKVAALNRGESYVSDVPAPTLRRLVRENRFQATTEYARLEAADTVTICVPTPLGPGHLPDLTCIEQAVDGLVPYLHREQLVVLESTTYPGTTEEVIQPRLEATGLKTGVDFYLGFAPERIDPGATSSQGHTLATVPKLVAGATSRCRERVTALYQAVVNTVVPVSTLKTAEMAKLVENSFRMVNIGFANEVALMCHLLDLDVWEVIDAAATKPFGFLPHYPGPGLGGHCIPVDPYYLAWKLKTLDYTARFIELAGEVNRSMPAFVVSRVAAALERHGLTLRGANVLVLGVTYKRDVADTRESPSLDVLSLLLERGAQASFHDPLVEQVTVRIRSRATDPAPAFGRSFPADLTSAFGRPFPPGKGQNRSPFPGGKGTRGGDGSRGLGPSTARVHDPWGVLTTAGPDEQEIMLSRVELEPAVAAADCVVVTTDHSAYDWETLAASARLIVDTRNALRHVRDHARAEIIKL